MIFYLIEHAAATHGDKVIGLPVMREQGLAKVINLYPHYFTFVFVRNPFDRFVSYYLDGLRPRKDRGEAVPYKNIHECAEFSLDVIDKLNPIQDAKRKFGPHQIPFNRISYERHHVRRQKDFLLELNKHHYFGVPRFNQEPCSFIGRYENLVEDFNFLLDVFGVPHYPLRQRNPSPARMEKNGRKKHYSTYYDKSLRYMVEKLYACDLEFFGYDFEDTEKTTLRLHPLYDKDKVKMRNEYGIKLGVYDRLLLSIKRTIVFCIFVLIRGMLKTPGLRKLYQYFDHKRIGIKRRFLSRSA